MNVVKSYLGAGFDIKDLNALKDSNGFEPHKYALDILVESGMQGYRTSGFPIEQNHKLRADNIGSLIDVAHYRRLVGCLLYDYTSL